jgi:SAM-dependent methyltransferase
MGKKVLIAIPVRSRFGQPCFKTQQCLDLLRKQTSHTTQVFLAGGQQISQNSLTICNKFLAEDWDYLLYTGDDIIFPPYALDRLIAHDKDFVSGVCTWKSPPYMVPVMKDDVDGKSKHLLIHPENVQRGDLLEVDGVGSGFILVKRRVVENVRDYMRDKVYPAFAGEHKWFAPIPFFGVTVNAETGELLGSDFHFSKQAKLTGAQIFIDCGLICRHRWEAEYDITNHWAWLERYGGTMEEEKYFGDRLPFTPFAEDSIYWGEQGPPVNITVTSTGNQYHAAEHVCPALGCFWEPVETEGKAKTQTGYIIGWHVGDDESWHLYTAWANRFDRVLVHWVGSDIVNIPKWLNSPERVAHMNHPRFVHLVEEDRLVQEVKEYFENVHVCSIPTLRAYPVQPLPKEFAVAIYYPKHRHDFHYGDVMKEVIERMPDVTFHLYHLFGQAPDFEYPNAKWLGNLDEKSYAAMLANSSCMLRLSQHDGRPFSIIEAFIMGRRCILNFNMPFVHEVGNVPLAEEVIDKINKIRQETEPYQEASDYYRAENDYKRYKADIRSLMVSTVTTIGGYDYRQYWDNRWTSKDGRIGADVSTDSFVNDVIKAVIADADAESVLDVGCGSMSRWAELPVDAEKYIGVDVSPNAIRMASERFPDGTFFVADITKDTLPIRDIVIANSVLPHIKSEHFLTTVKKLTKLARKAVVFSHTPNVSGGGYQYKLPPTNEWRLGNSWTIESTPVPGSTIEVVVCKKGVPVLAQ